MQVLEADSPSSLQSTTEKREMSLVTKEDDSIEIREVWSYNLEDEMIRIREVIDHFPYVAMDTEFPGTVCKPVTKDSNSRYYDDQYESLRTNVNLLNMIQLGLTLSDEQGNLPKCGTNHKQCLWQFNFKEFNLRTDMYAIDSIELLRQSGIDFARNNQFGVDAKRFGDLLMGSGVVLNNEIQWVTFHCGYDFGYLLKLLSGTDLPENQSDFFDLVKAYFPCVYDIKYLMNFCPGIYGGLSKVAERLDVERVGTSHQAGSDSLLTARVFTKMKQREELAGSAIKKHIGFLYGLGSVDNND